MMNMVNSHKCQPPMGDCIYKVLPTLELLKKELSVPQKDECGTKKTVVTMCVREQIQIGPPKMFTT